MKILRRTPAAWNNSTEIMATGDIGVEIGTGRYKIGDNSSWYHQLPYELGKYEEGVAQSHPGLLTTEMGAAILTTANAAAARRLIGAGLALRETMQPVSKMKNAEAVTAVWGTNPSYSGQTGIAYNDARMAAICKGAILSTPGNGAGYNQISGAAGTAGRSPYFFEFWHRGQDVAIWHTFTPGYDVDYRVWVDDQPVVPWADQASGSSNQFLRIHHPSVGVRKIRVATTGNAGLYGIYWPGRRSALLGTQ